MERVLGGADWRVYAHPILGEYLPGAFPPSATNRTKFRKQFLNDGWRGPSVTSGGVRIVLRDRSFSIQPAGAAAPFCSREIYTAPMEWPTYELEGLRPRRHLPDDAAFTAAEENPVLVNRWEICCMICSSIECRVGVSQIRQVRNGIHLGAPRGATHVRLDEQPERLLL